MEMTGKTDIGRNRSENQDTYRGGRVPGVGAWGIVCDGMGGAQNGKLASAVAADCMEEMIFRRLRGVAEAAGGPAARAVTPDVLAEAIGRANGEVFRRSGEGATMMGTTVVCALMAGGTLHLAHVGDSRAYLFANGALAQLTRDHSMVQEMVDMGTLSPEAAKTHPERNVITRALGVEGTVEPTIDSRPLAHGDTVLLCTDGLTNMVGTGRMAEIMAATPFDDVAGALVQAALAAGGDDNITVYLMRYDAEEGVQTAHAAPQGDGARQPDAPPQGAPDKGAPAAPKKGPQRAGRGGPGGAEGPLAKGRGPGESGPADGSAPVGRRPEKGAPAADAPPDGNGQKPGWQARMAEYFD